MSAKRHIIVLGAGVTGLTSAVFLAEAGYQVTIVAAHVPGDESIEYTSPWAGAHWNPSDTPSQPIICHWNIQTYDYWVEILEREATNPRLPKSGLEMQDSYHFWDDRPSSDLWWSPHVIDFRQVSDALDPIKAINENTPAGQPRLQWGVCCRLPAINVPQYLLYLQEKARLLGAEVIKAALPSDAGLEAALLAAESTARAHGRKDADCFVNATGLGAKKLCADEAMHPIRGQTVLVKGEAAATRSRYGEGEGTYCIPRPGAGSTVLGGVKQKGKWNEAMDVETTRDILERNRLLVPELLTGTDGGFEVISVQVGLRPGRTGGPRLERETVGGKKVVHAYGHGGAGYQHSVGSARLVVKMVTESSGGSNVIARL